MPLFLKGRRRPGGREVEVEYNPNAGDSGTNLVVVSDTLPDASVYKFWLRVTDVASSAQLYVSVNGSWVAASAGTAAGDIGQRQVGIFNGDPDDGNFVGLFVNDIFTTVKYQKADGSGFGRVQMGASGVSLAWDDEKSFSIQINNQGIHLYGNIPTTDPHDFGAIWDDGGTLKRSSG